MLPLSCYPAAWQVLVNQLCFLSTQYVSEVVIGAPYSVTAELLDHFKVRVGLLVGREDLGRVGPGQYSEPCRPPWGGLPDPYLLPRWTWCVTGRRRSCRTRMALTHTRWVLQGPQWTRGGHCRVLPSHLMPLCLTMVVWEMGTVTAALLVASRFEEAGAECEGPRPPWRG